MTWRNDRRLMELLDLANRKGYLFTKALVRDHVRLADPDGRRVVKDNGSSALSCAEAQRFLEALPDK